MTFELGRSLLIAEAISADALAGALLVAATQGVALPRALLATGAIDARRLEQELARVEAPVVRHVVPVAALVDQLPPGLCDRLLAIPLRRDGRTGTVDVAVVDARDSHAADEIGYWLHAPIRVLRASLAAMDAALTRMKQPADRGMRPLAAPIWVPMSRGVRQVSETPLYGTRAIDPDAHEHDGARADARDAPRELPIPLRRRAHPDVVISKKPSLPPLHLGSKEFPTLDETLPEPEPPNAPVHADEGDADPVLDLRNPKPSSSRPAPASEPPISRAPVTARGPFAPNAPSAPFADITPTLAGLRAATSRDEVLELLLAGARTVARKVALFVVKRDVFAGWACTPELGDRDALRSVKIPTAAPSILAQGVAGAGAHLGRVLALDAHAELLRVMKPFAGEVAVAVIRIDGRPAVVVLAGELGDTMAATKRLDELADVAGDALARIVREKRAG